MISIVLTTYNNYRLLPRALNSAIIQTVNKEVILVNDGSTEPLSKEVENIIKGNGIIYIKHEQNKGLSAARNTGISIARNPWIIPLDQDDFYVGDAVTELSKQIENNTDIIYGNVYDSGLRQWVKPCMQPFTKELIISQNPLFCSSMFKKTKWTEVGGYTERQGSHYEDWNFWAKCFACNANFKYADVNVYQHTWNPESMSGKLHTNTEYYKKLATEGVFK